MIERNLVLKKVLLFFIVAFMLTSCASISKSKDTISNIFKPKNTTQKEGNISKNDAPWTASSTDSQKNGAGAGSLNPPLKSYWEVRVSKLFKVPSLFERQHSSPAAKNDTVYVGSTDNIFFAFDIKEKKVLWRFKTTGPIESSPTVHLNRVFFGTTDGKVYSLNADTGEEEWSFQTTSPILASPLIIEEKVIIKTVDGKVYALDVQSGKKIWQYMIDIKEKLYIRDYTSPVYLNGKVLLSFSTGSLTALKANDGSEIFNITISTTDNIFVPGQPIVDNGLIFIKNSEGKLFIFDEEGAERWHLDAVKVSSFTVTRNKILVMDSEGFVLALNKVTGERLWRRKLTRGSPVGSAATQDLLITTSRYVSSLFNIEWLSMSGGYMDIFDLKTGKKLWSYKVESGISSPPVVAGDKILFMTEKGLLHILKSY